MAKFTAEEKLQAVTRYLTGRESSHEIANSLGTDNTTILVWVKQYEYNGVCAFVKSYTTYTQQFKMDVLNYMTEYDTSSVETAAIFNIPSPSNVRTWKRQFEAHGMEAPHLFLGFRDVRESAGAFARQSSAPHTFRSGLALPNEALLQNS